MVEGGLREAKKMLKEWYEARILWRDYPIYIVNLREGARAYYRETGKIPVVDARVGWDSEYGTVESHGGKHFVFLNSIIVDNYCEGDVLSTLIHEILHIIHPNDSEENVEEMTKTVCEHFNIKPDKILREL